MNLRHVSLWAASAATAFSMAQPAAQPPKLTLDQLREQRRQLAFRPRGIIANNDGCDVLYFPKDAELTAKAFLDRRTTALAGTGVGAIAYCTISSGFSFFTHDTKTGTLLDRQSPDYGIQPHCRNVAAELIAQGADCLQLVVDYGHAHDMEVFWSMRMNDTHDAAHHPDKPYLLYPPLKEAHPDWLVGDIATRRTRHGRWSSVNYALPQVRDLAFDYIQEVCREYDVDGIELDFFRHMCYFPSVADGGVATDEERQAMTGFMRRVRDMTETVGLARGRPILVALRVADSAGFNRDMGLDLERWLSDGLADILITTGYFRLNPWDVSVELGHRHGVAVYPCLSDSRVKGGTRFQRSAAESYRGRAVNAWFAGADGIHLFNYFNPKADLWSELGSTASLSGLDKLFFVTVRDGNPDGWLSGARAYRTVPMLTPGHPLLLQPGSRVAVDLVVGEDVAAAAAAGLEPSVTAHVRAPGLAEASRLGVILNGEPLTSPDTVDDWLDFRVSRNRLLRGANRFEFELAPVAADVQQEPAWSTSFDGTSAPGRPWVMDRPATRTVAEVVDEALLIADRGTDPGDYRYYRVPWGIGENAGGTIEVTAKVVSGVSSVIFGNGATGERLRLYPDRIQFHHRRDRVHNMDTTDGFHTYRITIDGADITVEVDGRPVLDGKDCFAGTRNYRNEVAFGAASSGELGEALWKNVRVRTESAAVADLVVSIRYPKD